MSSSQLLSTPSTHRWSFSGLCDVVLNHAKELVFRASWSPLTRLAESAVVLYVVFFFPLSCDRFGVAASGLIRPVTGLIRRMLIVPVPLHDLVV